MNHHKGYYAIYKNVLKRHATMNCLSVQSPTLEIQNVSGAENIVFCDCLLWATTTQ